MAEERRKTVSRRDLARRPAFARLSPTPGQIDEAALDQALSEDPDEALGLLAEMASATDPQLRDLARRLAGRVLLRMARSGRPRSAGVGRLRLGRLEEGSDLDVDASVDELLAARAGARGPDPEQLWGRGWARPRTAVSLVVDRSGSMGGQRLAAAALAAAAVAWRAPDDFSVLAFAEQVVVIKAQDETRPVEAVVDDVLSLKGHGTTNIALALQVARQQLERSPARDRVVILVSDGRATAGADPLPAARALDHLLVLAPAGDAEEARALASAAGGRLAELDGPASIPAALGILVGG